MQQQLYEDQNENEGFTKDPIPFTQESVKEEQPVPEQSLSDGDEEETKGYIPRKRLDKEIEKKRALQEQLQKEREENIRYKTELELYTQALEKLNKQNGDNNQTESIIEPLDREAHNYYEKKLHTIEQKIDQAVKEILKAHHNNAMDLTDYKYTAQKADFTSKNPNYDEAFQYLYNVELENEKLFVPDPQKAARNVEERLIQIKTNLISNNMNAPEMLYKFAKNYGYRPNKEKETFSKSVPDLDAISKNMSKSKSINDIPAAAISPSGGEINYIRMENFDKLRNENGRGINPKEFRRVLEAIERNER
jgi:hypothetical protein